MGVVNREREGGGGGGWIVSFALRGNKCYINHSGNVY